MIFKLRDKKNREYIYIYKPKTLDLIAQKEDLNFIL